MGQDPPIAPEQTKSAGESQPSGYYQWGATESDGDTSTGSSIQGDSGSVEVAIADTVYTDGVRLYIADEPNSGGIVNWEVTVNYVGGTTVTQSYSDSDLDQWLTLNFSAGEVESFNFEVTDFGDTFNNGLGIREVQPHIVSLRAHTHEL